jgi:hypothetical protein
LTQITKQEGENDPVACDEFVERLLDGGLKITAIKHEGVDLCKHEFDRIIDTAAGLLASKRICVSLGIKPQEERSVLVSRHSN